MKLTFISFFIALFVFLLLPAHMFAQEKASASSATFAESTPTQSFDERGLVLEKYLESQNSPLAPYAYTFVSTADKYALPWQLLVAITGTESTLGKVAPCNNFYGFGIYGDHMLCFTSIEDGIDTVSKSLRQDYINKWGATDVYAIGKLYAASPTWADHTMFFVNQINAFKMLYDFQVLPISL